MKQVKLSSVKDGKQFKRNNRSTGATYKVITKAKGFVVFTSLRSEKSFAEKGSLLVWVK